MTNLLIGHNRYTIDATPSATTAATGYGESNLQTGDRWKMYKPSSNQTSTEITYSYSANRNANYYVIARADLAIKADASPTFTVASSTDDVSYTNFHASGTLSSSDLVGPNSEDYIYYDAALGTAGDFWKLTIGYAVADVPQISKFYIGEALDLGRDPVDLVIQRKQSVSESRPHYEISMKYEGVSYTNTLTLLDTVAEIGQYHPVFLFTTLDHDVLNGARVIHCKLVSINTPQKITNQNDIDMVFRGLV